MAFGKKIEAATVPVAGANEAPRKSQKYPVTCSDELISDRVGAAVGAQRRSQDCGAVDEQAPGEQWSRKKACRE